DATLQCFGDGVPGCGMTDALFVGSKPVGAGRWGHADLAGNVAEWVLDVYRNPYQIDPCIDCAYLNAGSARVARGGSFFGSGVTVQASSRASVAPEVGYFAT